MSKKMITASVISQEPISEDIFSMWLSVGDMAGDARPGQFISVYCGDRSRVLPRPISICEADAAAGKLRIVYRVVGAGTDEFSKLQAGDSVRVLGTLGNGYTLRDKKAILVAGGIGIPPMLELAKNLDCAKTIVLGFRDANTFLVSELADYGNVIIATDDGSLGTKGNVIDAIRANNVTGDVIYACGPMPMLKGLKAYAQEADIECQISLEERMACGIGACLGCICKSKEVDHHTNVHNKRICKDGPVFDAKEVEL